MVSGWKFSRGGLCRAQIASPAAAAFPVAVQHLLRTSLELRDRYPEGKISKHGLRSATA
jgi:hypothetical protein